MKIKTRNTCRICDSSLRYVLSLGHQMQGNIFPSKNDAPLPLAPLELVRCYSKKKNSACGLVQLKHTVPGSTLYKEYWYRSGVNQTMTDHLANIARNAEQEIKLGNRDVVLDIGCNDGTLLHSYSIKGVKKIGIDPAKNVTLFAKKRGIKVINDFFSSSAFFRVSKKKAKIITSIAMFYDLEDPNQFVSGIKKVLHNDGLWIMELSYLPMMLKQNSFDTICHEHLEYYALGPVDFLLRNHELEAIDVEFNKINGGSFRLYIMHRGRKKPSKRLLQARKNEAKLNLLTEEPYRIFRMNIEKIRNELTTLVKSEHKAGKKIYIYGASTKGNTILQFCNLDNKLIRAAADRNPDKWGKITPGTNIPIISEAEARAAKPDYFLVLPWHFIDEFIEREKDYLNSGGKFILPIPEVRIIDKKYLNIGIPPSL